MIHSMGATRFEFRTLLWVTLFAAACTMLPGVSLLAQPPAAPPATPKTKADEKKKLPDPETVRIEVREPNAKLELVATYYPSTMGKAAIPILLLHGFDGSRSDYTALALALQQQGHAVLAPDLRGHGDSTSVLLADGKRVELLAKKLSASDLNAMIGDLDHVKSWLLEKNNAGELNLEQLVIVGADWTCVTAMNFALRDWTAPVLLNYKNAQDVKALVLLSPEHSYKATNMRLALKHVAVGGKLSVFIAVGSQRSGPNDEAKRLDATLKRQHGESSGEKKPKDQEVIFIPVATNLQGTKLLDRNFNVAAAIIKFIEFRVRDKADEFVYTERIKP